MRRSHHQHSNTHGGHVCAGVDVCVGGGGHMRAGRQPALTAAASGIARRTWRSCVRCLREFAIYSIAPSRCAAGLAAASTRAHRRAPPPLCRACDADKDGEIDQSEMLARCGPPAAAAAAEALPLLLCRRLAALCTANPAPRSAGRDVTGTAGRRGTCSPSSISTAAVRTKPLQPALLSTAPRSFHAATTEPWQAAAARGGFAQP
eukprot:SAG11_NODE_1183_length_5593_cov_7.174190_7_plen_205_part_00